MKYYYLVKPSDNEQQNLPSNVESILFNHLYNMPTKTPKKRNKVLYVGGNGALLGAILSGLLRDEVENATHADAVAEAFSNVSEEKSLIVYYDKAYALSLAKKNHSIVYEIETLEKGKLHKIDTHKMDINRQTQFTAVFIPSNKSEEINEVNFKKSLSDIIKSQKAIHEKTMNASYRESLIIGIPVTILGYLMLTSVSAAAPPLAALVSMFVLGTGAAFTIHGAVGLTRKSEVSDIPQASGTNQNLEANKPCSSNDPIEITQSPIVATLYDLKRRVSNVVSDAMHACDRRKPTCLNAKR